MNACIRRSALRTLVWSAMLLVLPSCNIFESFDGPNGDAQLISAARACFDQGDMDCAREYYAQVSASEAENIAADSAAQLLNQAGATMAEFAGAFGSGGENVGKSFTVLAGKLSEGAGEAKRLLILEAFQKTRDIRTNSNLRGMIRFLTASAMLAELLAEDAGEDGNFTAEDLVQTPASCRTKAFPNPDDLLNPNNCALATEVCGKPDGKQLWKGDAPLAGFPVTGTEGMTGLPSFYMMNAALAELKTAFGADEIGQNGTLASSISEFMKKLIAALNLVIATSDPCTRLALLQNGIGVN